ncbi:MAG: hypothetical protein PHE55_08810 [Methylococcaceae bacterium]|nr:hypothetical protein [Methylococcaceae bacterium]
MANSKANLQILGMSGLKQWGGIIDEETYSRLRGTRRIRLYREMDELSSVIGSIRYLMRALVRGVKWSFMEADSTPQAQEWAEFAETCGKDMEHTFEDFISEALSMIAYGFAPFEICYKIRRGPQEKDPSLKSKFDDGRVGWRKFAMRSQDTIDHWEFGDKGELKGVWQIDPNSTKTVFIPEDKLLLFRTESTKDNPEGRSIYHNAVVDYEYLKHIQKIEAIGIERDMTGLLTMEVPIALLEQGASSDKKALLAQIEEMMGQLKRDEREYAIVPPEQDTQGNPTGFRLKLLASGGRRQIDTAEIKKSYKISILQTVLAQFIELGMGDVGSFALASSQTNTFAVALGSFVDILAATFNRFAVSRLMEANGVHPDLWPTLEHGDIENPPLAEVAQYVTALAAAGQLPETDDIKRKLLEIGNLPVPEIGDVLPKVEPTPEPPAPPAVPAVSPEEPDGITKGKDWIAKPFANEHAARQTDPKKYDMFRRGHPAGFPAGIDVVYGIKDGKSEIQTLRFDSQKWTAADARKWCEEHNFKVGQFEEAAG